MRRIIRTFAALSCSFAVLAQASGLRVPVDNGLGTPGNAGGAALAEDASTGVTNPAGLIRIDHPELVVGISPVFSTVDFSGTVTIDRPVGPNPNPETGSTSANIVAPLFAVHYSHPLSERVGYSIGLTNPFGQGVTFGNNSLVSASVTDALLVTWNISNNFGYKINNNWSVGVGLDVQRLDFKADNVTPTPGPGADIYTSNDADGWGYGYHAGILYMTDDEQTRIGFNYNSEVDHKATGRSFATQDLGNLGTPIENKDFSVQFTLPRYFTLSGYHHITEKISIMGTTQYYMWGAFDEIKFKNIANNEVTGGSGPLVVKQSYKNSWVFMFGSYYQWTEDLRVGWGVRIDKTPTNPKYVNVEFPESDFWALGASLQYRFNSVVKFEFGYTHSFYQSVDINYTCDASGVTNEGKGKLHASLINTQLTINLAPFYGIEQKK
jgi:long-chain fatty acid transport protein